MQSYYQITTPSRERITEVLRISVDQLYYRDITLPIIQLAIQATQSITQQQSNQLAKKKRRNQKTRVYHKKKKTQTQIQAQSNHVTSQIQEVEHTGVKAYINETEPSKHIVLKHMIIWMAISVHTVVIYLNNFMDGIVLIDHWTIRMRRIGVD